MSWTCFGPIFTQICDVLGCLLGPFTAYLFNRLSRKIFKDAFFFPPNSLSLPSPQTLWVYVCVDNAWRCTVDAFRERERDTAGLWFWAQLSLLDSVWSKFWTWFFRNGCLMYELIPAESKMSILSLPLISLIVQTSWEILLLLFRILLTVIRRTGSFLEAVIELNANTANTLMCRRIDGYSRVAHQLLLDDS